MILHNFDLFKTNTIYLFIIISYIVLFLLSFNRQRADRNIESNMASSRNFFWLEQFHLTVSLFVFLESAFYYAQKYYKIWLDQVNEISELFRFSLPYYIAVLLPILIILSPADAATEFPVYRLQHFDLQGIKYGKNLSILHQWSICIILYIFNVWFLKLGSRSSTLNFEARSVDTRNPARKCVMLMINEFNPSRFRELINEGVGAILIIIPSELESLTDDMREVEPISYEVYMIKNCIYKKFSLEHFGCWKISSQSRNCYSSIFHSTFWKIGRNIH